MMYFGKIIVIPLSIFTFSAHAGFHGFTMHSRANCAGFNESISWEFNKYRYLQTFSQHNDTAGKAHWSCNLNTGWQYTWRSAAYHYKEGYSSNGDRWHVEGQHWGLNAYNEPVRYDLTSADDCNIYDGWWDK